MQWLMESEPITWDTCVKSITGMLATVNGNDVMLSLAGHIHTPSDRSLNPPGFIDWVALFPAGTAVTLCQLRFTGAPAALFVCLPSIVRLSQSSHSVVLGQSESGKHVIHQGICVCERECVCAGGIMRVVSCDEQLEACESFPCLLWKVGSCTSCSTFDTRATGVHVLCIS